MRIEIGSKMYLFLDSEVKSHYADMLVISAHGAIERTASPTFTVPYGNLQFYSDHGVVTDDFGLRNFASGGKSSQKKDVISAGDECYNYGLSKYQGRHSSANETYESIGDNQQYARQLIGTQLWAESQGYRIDPATKGCIFDVLTIRNRVHRSGIDLKEALHQVGLVNRYAEIHCYFCRSFYS